MTSAKISQIQKELKDLQKRDKLDILAAVAGISKHRLRAIADGAEPTSHEVQLIEMMR